MQCQPDTLNRECFLTSDRTVMIEHLPSSLARHRQWRLEGIRPDGYGLGQVCQAGDSRHAEVTRIMHLKTSETIQKTDGLKQALKVHTGVGRKRSSVRPRGQDDQTRPWLSMSHQRAFEPRCVHGRLYVAPFTATGAGAGAGAGRVNQCQHAVPRARLAMPDIPSADRSLPRASKARTGGGR